MNDFDTQYENIFERGALLMCKWSSPGHVISLKESELDLLASREFSSEWVKVSGKTTADGKKWIKGSKVLFDPSELKAVNKVKNGINSQLDAMSLEFPIKGVKFIPIRNIPLANNILTEGIPIYWGAVDLFVERWPMRYDEARAALDFLHNSDNYPADIRGKFGVEYQFLNLAAPSGAVQAIDPVLYAQEQKKFKEIMSSARIAAVDCLRIEFKSLVDCLIERLTPEQGAKPKVFRNSLVENFESFFEGFENRNVFEDADLKGLVDQARGLLSGSDAEQLRTEKGLADSIKLGMSQVRESLDNFLIDRPGRKITL